MRHSSATKPVNINANTKKKKKSRASGKMMTKILLGLVVVFLLAGAGGIYFTQEAQIARIRAQAAELNTEVQQAREKKAEQEDLFKKLDTPEYIEKIAREKLGMVKPGETVFPD